MGSSTNRRGFSPTLLATEDFPRPAAACRRPQPHATAVDRCSGMRPLASAATFPASAPGRQLDHILTDDGARTAVPSPTS